MKSRFELPLRTAKESLPGAILAHGEDSSEVAQIRQAIKNLEKDVEADLAEQEARKASAQQAQAEAEAGRESKRKARAERNTKAKK